MHDIGELWEWVKRIAGIVLVVCACLYIIRCVSSGSLVSFDQFDHYMRGLLKTIFG